MSRLYYSQVRKGTSRQKAFKLTGIAKALSKKYYNKKYFKGKMKGKLAHLDFDGDSKVNKYDCYPFDNKRQDDLGTIFKQIPGIGILANTPQEIGEKYREYQEKQEKEEKRQKDLEKQTKQQKEIEDTIEEKTMLGLPKTTPKEITEKQTKRIQKKLEQRKLNQIIEANKALTKRAKTRKKNKRIYNIIMKTRNKKYKTRPRNIWITNRANKYR